MSDTARIFVTIVLDGVGVGAQPDAADYGDEKSDTLGHVCRRERPSLPNLSRMGLGCLRELNGLPCPAAPLASFGKMREVSPGKDSTTGHWELAGIVLNRPFPTYPNGFPLDVIGAFLDKTGYDGILGNKAASGTEIIHEFGNEHRQVQWPIVYTSADSVFQVAAHKDVIPLEELYRICSIAREEVCVGPHAVGRVIARPFVGNDGAFERISADRKDFSLLPPSPPVQKVLQEHQVRTVSVGKIGDLFGNVGFDILSRAKTNADGIRETLRLMRQLSADDIPTFIWTNLVDFDQEYGHRNDVAGFAAALEAFDRAIPELLDNLSHGGRLVITADHGNDPTTSSTDHSREYVPLLLYGQGLTGRNLGTRATFADHAASVAEYFGVPFGSGGVSFLAPDTATQTP